MADLKRIRGTQREDSFATAIFRACKNGDLKHLKEMVAAGSDVNVRAPFENETPLMVAAKHGHVSVVDFLLLMDAQVNYVNDCGMTALMVACQHGELDCARSILFSWQCDIDKTDNDLNTALILTSQLRSSNQLSCLELLLEQDADVNITNNYSMTASMYCAMNENSILGLKGLQMLLNAGADPNAVNEFNENLLMQAIYPRDDKILQFLLDVGVIDLGQTNRSGDNVLIFALINRRLNCVDKLLQAGCDPNSFSGQGHHALNIAAATSFDMTLLLLTFGAVPVPSKLYVGSELRVNETDHVRMSAFSHCPVLFQPTDIAVLHRHFSIANLLLTISSSYPVYKSLSRSPPESLSHSTSIVLDYIQSAAKSCPSWMEISHEFVSEPNSLSFFCQQVISRMAGFSKRRCEKLNSFGLPPKLVRNILLKGFSEDMFVLTG